MLQSLVDKLRGRPAVEATQWSIILNFKLYKQRVPNTSKTEKCFVYLLEYILDKKGSNRVLSGKQYDYILSLHWFLLQWRKR